eukprot:4953082-Prorocentrum_lima.AAC.1
MATGAQHHVSQHVHRQVGAGCGWCLDAAGLGRRGHVSDRRLGLQGLSPSLQSGEVAGFGMAGHGPPPVGND